VAGLSDLCGRCRQEIPYALPRCPICRRPICDDCVVRMGGSSFCSTECAHAFFFGGEDEVGDEDGQSAGHDDDGG
jgi:hypothetical protein